ncbi:MAG: RNA ligase family protein [Polyangiales bacterium]
MNLRALVERIGLSKLNSLTKYPSILTYHALGDKGRLRPERNRTFAPGARVLVTEKVDGTNTRIVLLPATGEWLIGSREEWLHARGDLVASPALGIVEAVRATAERCANSLTDREGLVAIYGEVYGAKVTAASKQYTGGDPSLVGFRLFDAWSGSIEALVERVESSTPERLAAWREDCQQAWFDEDELRELSEKIQVEVAPRIDAKAPPEGVEETLAWLKETLPRTRVALSEGASGQPEGVVVRTPDRSVIAKIRFEDYERTVPREHAGRSR